MGAGRVSQVTASTANIRDSIRETDQKQKQVVGSRERVRDGKMNSFHENGLKPQDFYSYGTTAHT
jgi:hypothetical protein